jgi:hypothetical protein
LASRWWCKINAANLRCGVLVASFNAFAEEYSCKVYCDSGTTFVTVQASSSSDAAAKINPTPVANGICQSAGKGDASSSTMSGSQCSRN